MYSKRDRPVVILTTGRSGSTLFQKLLNTNPELTIWGEHEGILTQFMNAHRNVENSKWIDEHAIKGEWLLDAKRPVEPGRWTAWDGSFSKSIFRQALKSFLDSLFCNDLPEGTRWGFKEIRYFSVDIVNFLLSFYPGAQFIVLMRNPVNACVSFTTASPLTVQGDMDSYFKEAEKICKNRIKPTFAFFNQILKHDRSDTLAISFESLVAQPEDTMRNVGEFLNLKTSFERERIQEVMARNIVSQRKSTPPELYECLSQQANKLLLNEIRWYQSIVLEAESA